MRRIFHLKPMLNTILRELIWKKVNFNETDMTFKGTIKILQQVFLRESSVGASQVDIHAMTVDLERELPSTFHQAVKKITDESHILQITEIDYCVNQCVLFTNHLEKEERCPVCGEERYIPNANVKQSKRKRTSSSRTFKRDAKKARRVYRYISIIYRIRQLLSNSNTSRMMEYGPDYFRSKYCTNGKMDPHKRNAATQMMDIWDGQRIMDLIKFSLFDQNNNEEYKRNPFFVSERDSKSNLEVIDIAVGLSADGIGLFNKNKHTVYPITMQCYNLPPWLRYKFGHMWWVGLVDSSVINRQANIFFHPLAQELEQLYTGQITYV
jgi:hypothetical protein